ncbi:MAG: lipopolysaccharide heptosyltransferase II [Kiritimatiellae bacterium]|nr:lipopolysaccharide heptosyltransferase II [Kiritimatiellia bacterium]
MNASASAEGGDWPRRAAILGVNWIGDTLMSAPAVAVWRRRYPSARLLILARAAPAAVWRLLGLGDEVEVIAPGALGSWRAAVALRAWRAELVAVCPHSVRSSWMAAVSGAPKVVGLPGPMRRWFGIDVVRPALRPGRRHQQFEYVDLLLGPGAEVSLEPPRLKIPAPLVDEAEARLGRARGPRIAVMPGAARGPAKRWPAERFAETARRLAGEDGADIIVLGSGEDRAAAALVAAAAGSHGHNLAGETSVELWAAILSRCDLALANDSGGMHLAAAAGVAGVAIFGRTDPEVTGPLSPVWTVVRAPGAGRRDLRRCDRDAIRRLRAVSVDEVVCACRQRLAISGLRGALSTAN